MNEQVKFDMKSMNYDPLDKDIIEEVMSSLSQGYRDYIYNSRIKGTILQQCKSKKISVIYVIYYDKYGDFDYIEFIPVRFKKAPDIKRRDSPRLLNMQIDMKVIKENENGWQWEDKSKFKQYKVVQNRPKEVDN